ncbi:MAG: hypothetical protein ACXWEY_06820 [Bacteroidia bacterium]
MWFGLLSTSAAFAQSYDDDDRPVLKDEFCLKLKKIINDKPNNYANLADSLSGDEMPQAGMDGLIPVREDATFEQARRSMLAGAGSDTKYRTVFMVRDTREGLVPSYNNLLQMLKDCLYFDYEFNETSLLNVKEIASLGYKTYENIGKPLQINKAGIPQADIYFMIQKNKASRQYELVLEIR